MVEKPEVDGCNAGETICGGVARRGYARGIEGRISERTELRSSDSAAWAMAAALWVALGDGSPGDGHPLPVSTALGGLVSKGRLARGAAAPDGGQGTPALAESGGRIPCVRCGGHGAVPDRLG